ncbi:diguanylate cyclase [candidate division KSB3 bacterium]|uniref:Diguanylate cyclase n=1 Tax=candidate division KSB3 bacterium TaxID=2044937 RepID=A0A9D5JTZ6_9BACT|nr:diguanylate cyclase [candidate division KSB3 bacterium]MBD3323917.1 diguanylate cyclase [candidate division KSB3 bacterium]
MKPHDAPQREQHLLHQGIKQIERAKQEWEMTVDTLPQLICLLDQQGVIIRANRTIERWQLCQVRDVRGKSFHAVFHPACSDPQCYLNAFLTNALERVAHGQTAECEARDQVLHAHFNIQVRPSSHQTLETDRHSESFAVVIVDDITARKQVEEELQVRNRELSLLNDLSDLLQACEYEQETYTVLVNICKDLFPLTSGCVFMLIHAKTTLEIVASWGTPPQKVRKFPAEDCLAFRHNIIHATDASHPGSPCPHIHLSSPRTACLCAPISTTEEHLGTLSLYCNSPDPHLCQTAPAVLPSFKQMVVNKVVKHYGLFLANLRLQERDHLTGLYNRLYMEKSIERIQREEKERRQVERRNTAIFMLDIDHFKRFNDEYSYEAGDLVLHELGAFLRSKIRSEDIACRYGGEEFLLILPELTLESATKRAQELHQSMQALYVPYKGTALHITLSIGVAALPYHGPKLDDAIRAADVALHQAKARGRNQVVTASYENMLPHP